MLDERLRHGGVDVVVRHLIADAIGAPAERQFRQIAGAEHQRVILIGQSKQQRRSRAGLHILGYWAQAGLICFGPHRGKQPTLVLLDDWLADVDSLSLDHQASLEALALRYFQSHGPASDRDFAWWSGLSLTMAREAMQLAGERLREIVLDDTALWSLSSIRADVPAPNGLLHLLSPFDELLVGYKDRAAYDRVPGAPDEAITFFRPSVLLNGRLVGAWQKTMGAKSGQAHLQFVGDPDAVAPELVEA